MASFSSAASAAVTVPPFLDSVTVPPFLDSVDVLHVVASFLEASSLVQLSRANKFVPDNLSSKETLQWCARLRGIQQHSASSMTTLEHIELAECMAELETAIDFQYGDARLQEKSLPALAKFAAFLNRHSTITVAIEGHCGLEAPRAMARTFTRHRCAAVRHALEEHGVARERLTIKGYGNNRPLIWAYGDAGGAANRRVELYVTCGTWSAPPRRKRSEYAKPPSARGSGGEGGSGDDDVDGDSAENDDSYDEGDLDDDEDDDDDDDEDGGGWGNHMQRVVVTLPDERQVLVPAGVILHAQAQGYSTAQIHELILSILQQQEEDDNDDDDDGGLDGGEDTDEDAGAGGDAAGGGDAAADGDAIGVVAGTGGSEDEDGTERKGP